MYKTLKELLARDANGRLTLLNPLEPLNAEPTNRGTRAIATSVDKLLSARTAGQSFRVQSSNSSVAWDNDTSTLSVTGSLVLQCAFPVSGDAIEVSPYEITFDGDFSVPAYRVLILPETPSAITITDSDVELLSFVDIADLVEGITALSGDQQSRAVLIAAKHTTSVWLAPGIFIADGSTITNFGTDSQYAIQEDFLELEDHVFERDHVSFYETAGTSSLSLARSGVSYTITNNNSYSLTAVFKSNRQLTINIPSTLTVTAGQILYATYFPMEDDGTYSATATVGTWADAGSAETYITLLIVPSAGGVVFSPIGNNHITISTGRSGVPFTLCGRINPNLITYESAAQTIIRNSTFGSAIPVSPHTTASFPRLVKSGGSAQSAFIDSGVEAHTVVCGDLIAYGSPTSDPPAITLAPYPPSGVTYKIVKISPSSGTGTPGIETKFIFVDGNIWADDIFLGSTASARIRIRDYVMATQDDLDTAEDDIDALELRMDTAESEIDTLQTEMSAAEASITTLQSDVVTAQDTAEDAQLWAYAARFFGSAMDLKYRGTVNSGVGAAFDNSIFRIRPVLSCRVGEKIGTFQAGAVRGLSSDGIRLHILERYSTSTNRLRTVTLNAISSSFSTVGVPQPWVGSTNLGPNRAFLESSGSSVYGFESVNEILARFPTAGTEIVDSVSFTTSSFEADSIVLCNKYVVCWYVNTVDAAIEARVVGSTSTSQVHTPATLSSSVGRDLGTPGVPVGAGAVFCAISFGNISAVVYRDQLDDDKTKIRQFRINDDRTINNGPAAAVLFTSNISYARGCTDGEFFFVAAPTASGAPGLHISVFPIAGPSDENSTFNATSSALPEVFNAIFLSSIYLGINSVEQIFADGNTLYVVCSDVIYAFKYNGAPSSMTYCWKCTGFATSIVCATLTWAGLIVGLTGNTTSGNTQSTIVWIKTDTYGREIVELQNTPSADWLYRKPFRQLRTFMS